MSDIDLSESNLNEDDEDKFASLIGSNEAASALEDPLE